MKKYSAIIVLSAGVNETDDKNQFHFSNGKQSFYYIAKADPYNFRYKATSYLFKNKATSLFVLVGGPIEAYPDIGKAEVMKYTLENDFQIPKENLIALKSEANTLGNGLAVKEYLRNSNLETSQIGLLTNFYHIPRAVKQFMQDAGLYFIPISAESLLIQDPSQAENIVKFYRGEALDRIILNEKNNEIKGLSAYETDNYKAGKS